MNYEMETNNETMIHNMNNDVSENVYKREYEYDSTIYEDAHMMMNQSLIFRYKFTEDFMKELYNFSKVHQYDDRKSFKESWNSWVEDNEEVVESEIKRLNELGYDGDILDKMFKSARYYFRKKSVEPKEVKPRRQYITIDRELLYSMDNHIRENMYCQDYQPKTAFISFCIENESVVKNTLQNILNQGISDGNLIQDKIKKTYKNRYFIAVSNKK